MSLPARNRNEIKMLEEIRQDLDSSLKRFDYMVRHNLLLSSGSGLVPSKMKGDCIENQFCQQHGIFHGKIQIQHTRGLLKHKTQLYHCNPSFQRMAIAHKILAPIKKAHPIHSQWTTCWRASRWTTVDWNLADVKNTCNHVKLGDREI